MDAEPDEEMLLAEADQEVSQGASAVSKQEWDALLRLDRMHDSVTKALICWPFLTVLGALTFGRELLGAYRSGSETQTSVATWVTAAWLAVAVVLLAARRIVRRLTERIYHQLEWRGYDSEKIRQAVLAKSFSDFVRGERQERAAEHAEQERWSTERAAAPPWWRTELSGGQLLLNIYIVAAASVSAIPSARPYFVLFIPLVGPSVLIKAVIPALFAVGMVCCREKEQGLRDTWRYYMWWARSKVALAFLLLIGLLWAALIAPAIFIGPDSSRP